MLPPAFVSQMQTLLGAPGYADFEAALQAPAPVSIRLKNAIRDFQHELPFEQPHMLEVPWHPLGRYLSERPVFTLDPAFHAGAYYVQEASSMFLHEALRQTTDLSRPLKVLDLCAAPGGKSTLMLDMLHPESLLVSNEVIRARAGTLRENLEKWGNNHIAVTSGDPADFTALDGWFDLVVTDAPCSGEGLFRKDPDAIREWSTAGVVACAERQQRILSHAIEAVAPGGILIYSTCTYNTQENEQNVGQLLDTGDVELLSLNIPETWGIVRAGGGYQFFPHRVRGEGFFLAAFRKRTEPAHRHTVAASFRSLQALPKKALPGLSPWLRQPEHLRFFQTPSAEIVAIHSNLEQQYLQLDKHLKNKWFGTLIGTFKGQDFIPSHALALSDLCSPALPGIELERDLALLFLKKESFMLPEDAPRGWVLARYKGLNLGWMKVLPGRMNNYLPQERRIRMDVHGRRWTVNGGR
ncbi:MAG: rRNA cytosine-C5-methyltransferase [Saprospiraceae bacterium]|nr:rRNA cytosine-C5-methyltransferase [Saprospiraceae bacterium]